jgi:hypothetical protein
LGKHDKCTFGFLRLRKIPAISPREMDLSAYLLMNMSAKKLLKNYRYFQVVELGTSLGCRLKKLT